MTNSGAPACANGQQRSTESEDARLVPSLTSKVQVIDIVMLRDLDMLDPVLVFSLDPVHLLGKQAAVLDQVAAEEVTARREAVVFEGEDGSVGARLGLETVVNLTGVGDGVSVHLDGEGRGREVRHDCVQERAIEQVRMHPGWGR